MVLALLLRTIQLAAGHLLMPPQGLFLHVVQSATVSRWPCADRRAAKLHLFFGSLHLAVRLWFQGNMMNTILIQQYISQIGQADFPCLKKKEAPKVQLINGTAHRQPAGPPFSTKRPGKGRMLSSPGLMRIHRKPSSEPGTGAERNWESPGFILWGPKRTCGIDVGLQHASGTSSYPIFVPNKSRVTERVTPQARPCVISR